MTDKSADSSHSIDWREKYLSALDAQETLEKQCAQQQELLRRALLRVSVSADGQDTALDEALAELREKLREQSRSGASDLPATLARMDKALLGFEQQRKQAIEEVGQALTNTLAPLQKLSLSRALKRDIRHYVSQLPQRTEKIRLYPALLQQLAEIQQQAMNELRSPPQGLWQKILGNSSSEGDLGGVVEETLDEEVEADLVTTEQASTALVTETISSPSDEPTSDGLIASISQLLADLLKDIDVPETIGPRVEEIQQQIAKGLTGKEVIVTLAAVRDLVMEAYLLANKAFATYLNNVNQELADIYAVLGGAAEHQSNRLESSRELQDSMMQHMENLEVRTEGATDLDQLKNMVQSQLGNIRQALHHYHQSEQDQQQLSTQLQELATKIKNMESEAEKNRSTLERHRYKSLHDPLTELPNREAYNERVEYEYQRWQRYKHPLTLAICDLDYFKRINDSLGHQAGDRVLKVISRSIAKRLREVDFFGRYGGEEFVVVMPETTDEQAFSVLDKIRIAIASTAFNYKNQPLEITLSMGVTQFRQGESIETTFSRADAALYVAKAEGRNRCKLV